MAAAGQKLPEAKPVLEVNPVHQLIQRLEAETLEKRFVALAQLVLDQATLSEGGMRAKPAACVQRLNQLLLELMQPVN